MTDSFITTQLIICLCVEITMKRRNKANDKYTVSLSGYPDLNNYLISNYMQPVLLESTVL